MKLAPCNCSHTPQMRCLREASQEDLLCDVCRLGCTWLSIGPPISGNPTAMDLEGMTLVDGHMGQAAIWDGLRFENDVATVNDVRSGWNAPAGPYTIGVDPTKG